MCNNIKSKALGVRKRSLLLVFLLIISMLTMVACDSKEDVVTTQEFELVSCYIEYRNITNGFGGVVRIDEIFHYGYVDDNGKVIFGEMSFGNHLDLKVTDLNEMAGRIVKSLLPVSEAKNVTLTNATNREALAMVDREKFWQVVYNITDNAVKYTPSGGTVTVYVFNEGEYCRIEIVDTGIGIPEDDVNKIFDRFYRVDKARARESGGTGLGLSIANDVVMMHEGKILVDSKEGVGTKFIIIVPKKLQLED